MKMKWNQPRRRSPLAVTLLPALLHSHGCTAWLSAAPSAVRPLFTLASSTLLKRHPLDIAQDSRLQAEATSAEPSVEELQSTSKRTLILQHLSRATVATDVEEQMVEMELAERGLLEWAEECQHRSTTPEGENKPDASVFSEVIRGWLAMPPSAVDSSSSTLEEDDDASMEELRVVMNQGKRHRRKDSIESHSQRAIRLLDRMESMHQPTASLYDNVILSICNEAFHLLNQPQTSNSKQPPSTITTSQAWKCATSAYQLLNTSEELYRETGVSSQAPAISSYVAVMDVWRALAVQAQEDGDDKSRMEALEIVKGLHGRRLEVYSWNEGMDNNAAAGVQEEGVKYHVLTVENTFSVQQVLQSAMDMLRRAEPSYQPSHEFDSIGTWHFNQLIFDLAKYPQPFSGPLAQDLLEYMVATVQRFDNHISSNTSSTNQETSNPIIPKPNTATINGVLKAWMVTPPKVDAPRRAESVLAQIAIWQSQGILWGSEVRPDVVSYNTCIACWKDSGIPGAAARSTEILNLLETDEHVRPDVITYASCMGAWAEAASTEKGAAKKAEEILTRMYQRSKEEEECPKPNTRCFNAVLLAYANGRETGGGKRALDLLRFMERLSSEGYPDMKPDSYTLNIVMKALTNCGEEGAAEKAKDILKRMEDSYANGDKRRNADLLSYNIVLDSFAKKGDAISAEALLNQMYKGAKRDTDVILPLPDAHSYTTILSAWAKYDDKLMAVKRAEDLFNDLESKWAAGETDTRADTSVYNALINCWAKSGDKKTLYRVTQILDLMEELGLQGGDSDVAPNTRTYCAVLDALARSRNWKAYNESLGILDRMEELYAEGYESVRPCARAYSIVISTIARSRKKGKAIKAQEILHRMENEYRKGNMAARPTVYSYNAVLNAAAYTPRGDEHEQEEAFKVACLTFDQLRMSDYLKPSHVSFGTFLKAIQNHMPSSQVRDDLVESVFRRCCR